MPLYRVEGTYGLQKYAKDVEATDPEHAKELWLRNARIDFAGERISIVREVTEITVTSKIKERTPFSPPVTE